MGSSAAAERAELHGRAARQLAEGHDGGDRVAEHLMVADPAGDPWVVERLSEAAQAAAASGAPECGAAYLRRALAEPPSQDAGATLLLQLGLAEFSAGERGWEEHLEGAVAAAADDTGRIAVAMLLATALGGHQRLPEALDVVERVAAVDGSQSRSR